jgi:alginate O-acetyltransferase complex protein AlgI
MFSPGGDPTDALGYLNPYTVLMLICAVLFSMPILPAVRNAFIRRGHESLWNGMLSVLCIPLFLLCVMTLASSAFNPFIYYIF